MWRRTARGRRPGEQGLWRSRTRRSTGNSSTRRWIWMGTTGCFRGTLGMWRRRSGERWWRRVEARWLPDAADAKLIEFGVDANYGNVEREGLGGDHAVERIAVISGKTAGAKCGFGAYRDENKADFLQCLQKPDLKGLSFGQLTDAYLGCNLPGGGSRDKNLGGLVSKDFRCFFTQRFSRDEGPQQRVGIEQNGQSSSPLQPFGSGSKMAFVGT